MPKPRVFLSYARRSDATAHLLTELEPMLTQAGARVLRDVRIELGTDWEAEIGSWIAHSHVALVLVSREAFLSPWVKTEVEELVRRRRVQGDAFTLIPVLMEGLTWEDVHQSPLDGGLSAYQGNPEQHLLSEIADVIRRVASQIGLPQGLIDGVERDANGQRAVPSTAAGLLRSAHELIGFTGRAEELANLHAWLDTERPVDVQLVHGPAGVGKTRMVQELIHQRNEVGWDAGFLRKGTAHTPVDLGAILAHDRHAPLLVVVDYAETRMVQTGALLRMALERVGREGTRATVRVLLVARNDGDWWPQVTQSDAALQMLVEGRVTPSPLGPLPTEPERTEVWANAWAKLGGSPVLALTAPPPACPPVPPLFGDDTLARPLFLQMAALVMLREGTAQASWSSADDLLRHVLTHESRYWRGALEQELPHLPPGHERRLRPLLGALVLAGGCDDTRLSAFRDHADADLDPRAQLDAVRRLYGETGRVRALEPDALGEHLVDEVLAEQPERLEAVFARQDVPPETPLTVLTRLAARTGNEGWLQRALEGHLSTRGPAAVHTAVQTGAPMPAVLEGLLPDALPLLEEPTLDAMMERLPEPHRTVSLRGVGAQLAEAQVAHCQAATAPRRSQSLWGRLLGRRPAMAEDEDALSKRARRLRTLGLWTAQLGQREAALQATQEAVDIFRRLAEARPDAFLPDLALSLNNLGAMQSALGRREDALQATQEATDIRRRLAEARPDASSPTWPTASTTWATCSRSSADAKTRSRPPRRPPTSFAGSPRRAPTPSSPTWPPASTTWATGSRSSADAKTRSRPPRRPPTSFVGSPRRAPTPSSPTWPPASTTWASGYRSSGDAKTRSRPPRRPRTSFVGSPRRAPTPSSPTWPKASTTSARCSRSSGDAKTRSRPPKRPSTSVVGSPRRAPTPSSPTWPPASTTSARCSRSSGDAKTRSRPPRRPRTSFVGSPRRAPTPSSPTWP